jgi:acetoin utilization deacetylase AcuC-like enzyme
MVIGRVFDPLFLDHGEVWHPENRTRLEAVVARLQESGLWDELEEIPALPADEEQLQWLHTQDYIEDLRLICQSGGGALDPDTVATSATFGAALVAAGSCMWSTRLVVEGGLDSALCLVRPPGHHALPSRAMGFCFFNNAALAAEMARALGVERVALLDWDVHHGNGSQEMFYHRGDVLYASIHQHGIFPGTGSVDEVGVDAGSGRTINIPLPGAAMDDHYLRAWDQIVVPAVRSYQPGIIIVSAGYDGHYSDSLASHLLTTDGYYRLAERTRALAEELCEGRLCVVLEGGYALDALARGVESTVLAMLGRPVREPDPGQPQVHPMALSRVDEYLDQAIAVHRARLQL